MIGQIIYIGAMLGIVTLLYKHGTLFDYYTPDEWESKLYKDFMSKHEPKILKARLEEINNGRR